MGCVSLRETAPIELAPWIEAAAQRNVRILRDEFGVPHIYGETDPEVAFGLAYAHAEDDFETNQKVMLSTRPKTPQREASSSTFAFQRTPCGPVLAGERSGVFSHSRAPS